MTSSNLTNPDCIKSLLIPINKVFYPSFTGVYGLNSIQLDNRDVSADVINTSPGCISTNFFFCLNAKSLFES